MRKKPVVIAGVCLAAVLVLVAVIAGMRLRPGVFVPAGSVTGVESLDEAVLAVLRDVCEPKGSLEENTAAVYDWICTGIRYRPGTADVSGGFSEALVNQMAEETLNKRRGNCDGEAALMVVMLRRLGWEAVPVTGQFCRDDGVWVDHAWAAGSLDGGDVYHFGPLYGSTFADEARDYFMKPGGDMAGTHRFDAAAVKVY